MSILVRIIRLQDEPKSQSTDTCMKYLCLMYLDETAGLNVPQDAIDKGVAECRAFFDAIQQNGQLLGRNTLQPTRTATTVRVRDGKTITTDGPFAETKEQLGGYFLIEARDLNEAIRVAAGFPGARWGCVEVRPINEISQPK
jgi:hypothetical protein